ncbi:trehalose-phosphatase [Deinococcus yavapaiensis]|uniref:Trehalose 6-phosphate phosphatase n=1 Tax=Deinococcus yavapaiensis KR-236 TaxID=694435 RepID=A0A318SA63_9DEIO|nr:trehalose-phosphatase [Deinococcus yavapaiensis]PYE53124.1 trehalose 6-phosphatase [Deinococcus yavapaiensis KR-236]
MTSGVEALAALARRPLLIVLDYDGTLAPIAPTPEEAVPEAGAREAVAALLAGGRHLLRVLSGRPSAQVRAFLGSPDLPIVGLHGLEWPGEALPREHTRTVAKLAAAVPDFPGRRLEDKGVTLAVHYRATPDDLAGDVQARLERLPVPEGWTLLRGKRVVEFRPSGANKGTAVMRLARDAPDHLPVYVGDDVTDEEAFEVLADVGGVTIKVGEGETRARHRVASPSDVVTLLRTWANAPSEEGEHG